MNHREIEENAITERYLNHALPPAERTQFERHLVDCQECIDRLLLAEMFHARNGQATKPDELQVKPQQSAPFAEPQPIARVIVYRPRMLGWIFAIAVLLIPAGYFIWRAITAR